MKQVGAADVIYERATQGNGEGTINDCERSHG